MRTKVLVSILTAILLLSFGSGCRSNKANEKQRAANQQEASPTPSSETSAPQASSPAEQAPKPKKPKAETPPPSEPESSPVPSPVETPTPAPTPTPTPPPPIVVSAGTVLSIRTTSPISTNNSQVNQEFEASIAKPVLSGDETVIPVGAPVKGVILKAESAGRIKGEGGLSLQLTSLTLKGRSYKLITSVVAQQSKGRGKRSAAMIGGGGAGGALIGGLTGGGKGAAIGALAGAAAGTAGATLTGKRDVVIPSESTLDFKLSEPLTLPPRQSGSSADGDSVPRNSMPPPQQPEQGSEHPQQPPN